MDVHMIATHLENIDRRLTTLEQILPTLATKDELKTLATKDDLKTLATKGDLGDLRRYMDVLTESLRGDIHLIAAHVASARPKGNEP
jgi:hypothetical protein